MTDKKLTTKQKIIRTTIVVLIIALIIGSAFLAMYYTGFWEKINTAEKAQKFIQDILSKMGIWAWVVFVFLQFIQVSFLPIPAAATTLAGIFVFQNPLLVAILSLVGILLGSIFAFWLGRKFGTRICNFMLGKETTEKWSHKLGEGKYIFFLMMLFPVFPDDIICMIAGLTSMSWKFFIVTNLITRPIAVFGLCYVTSGKLIPFSGWGIPVWIVLICVGAILFILAAVYRKKIEEVTTKWGRDLTRFVSRLFKKNKTRLKSHKKLNRSKITALKIQKLYIKKPKGEKKILRPPPQD